MNDITEREDTMRDVVLAAINTERLYHARKSVTAISTVNNWIQRNYSLSQIDSIECLRQIFEHWSLENNDK